MKMEFTPIVSRRGHVQILDKGFRLKLNKGPLGPFKTSFFTCVVPGCKARAATLGDLNPTDMKLKYHRIEQHTHGFSFRSKNSISKKLYRFYKNSKDQPDKTAKAVYKKAGQSRFLQKGVCDPSVSQFDRPSVIPSLGGQRRRRASSAMYGLVFFLV